MRIMPRLKLAALALMIMLWTLHLESMLQLALELLAGESWCSAVSCITGCRKLSLPTTHTSDRYRALHVLRYPKVAIAAPSINC